jgi:hypothetical protein
MPVPLVQPAQSEQPAPAIAPEAAQWIASGLGPLYDHAVAALRQLHGAWWGTASGTGLLYNCTSSNNAQILTMGTVTSTGTWPQITVGSTSASNTLVLGNVVYQDYRPRGVVRDPDPVVQQAVHDGEAWRAAQAQSIAAAEAERERRREEQARRAARMQVSESRARSLLISCLNEEQRAEFEAHGQFHVRSRCGRRFRIEHRWSSNLIEEVECDGRWLDQGLYCVHPRIEVPVADSLLAQKMWIENDVDGLLALANRHR